EKAGLAKSEVTENTEADRGTPLRRTWCVTETGARTVELAAAALTIAAGYFTTRERERSLGLVTNGERCPHCNHLLEQHEGARGCQAWLDDLQTKMCTCSWRNDGEGQ